MTKTKTTTKNFTATEIATILNEATTPSEKGAATRRLKTYIEQRVAEGKDRSRVEITVNSLRKKLSQS